MRLLKSSIGILGLMVVGLSSLSAQTWELIQRSNSPLPSDSIRSIAAPSASKAWIGTEKGLAQYNNNQWTTYNQTNSPLPDDYIQALKIDGSDVWIGTRSGLVKLSNGSWNVYQVGTSQIPSNDVEDLAMDNAGNLWIATYGGGVAQFDDSLNSWTVYDTGNSTLGTNRVQAIDVSMFGNIWIGTSQNGAYKYDFINWSNFTTANSGIAANFPSAVAIDQSDVWFGFNGNGLSAFNFSTSNWQNYGAATSNLPNNYVTDIVIGLAQSKWVGTRFGGVGRLDSGGTWITYDSSNTILPSQTVLAVETNPQGDQWFGTDEGIVYTGCVPKFDTISAQSCQNYLSPSGSKVWTSSGTYNDTIPTTNNCDSIITVNLTINQPASVTFNETTCDSFTSPSGDTTWTTSGTYEDTLSRVNGCDSVITFNLTINNTQSSTISETACGSYTVPSGDTTWTTSGTYQDTIATTAGCDSIITINLTINTVDTGVNRNGVMLESVESNASYQWLDCENGYAELSGDTSQTFSPASTGIYAVEVSKNGCVDTSPCYNIQGNTIKGTVTYKGSQLDTGEVFLYEVSSNNYNKVDSLLISGSSNGQYQFNNLDTGEYILKAYSDSSSSMAVSAVPTYHDSTVTWSKANKINLSSNQIYAADIYLKEPKKQQGPGSISGTIVESGPQKRRGPGDPQGGIEILALTGDGDVEDYDVSAKDGTYEFKNMSLDTHRVVVEITGFTAKGQEVTLTQDNQTADSLTFEIDKDEDSVYLFVPEIRENSHSFEAYRVYPNPAKTQVNLVIETQQNYDLTLRLMNAKGQPVLENSWQVKSGINKRAIPVEGLSNGVYFLNLVGEDGEVISLRKLIVNR